jgi:hypothetical protein
MKTILVMGVVGLGLLQSARAFSLAGPVGNGGDAWQIPTIGWGSPRDGVAGKNIGEEYRRNTPVMYYAFDANFLGFFGSDGMVAVDGAFAILNSLTNVSAYSTSLSEFPLESRHNNYQAQALGLLDLKSWTLGIMVHQMGLADPVMYTWELHDRYQVPGTTCPVGMEYLVVQRNFDIVSSPLNQLQYSPYVNDILYSYDVIETCGPVNPVAYADPFSVDPLADTYSPVATFDIGWGDFYTGLTRDDMAGWRYLMQATNVNWESAALGSTLYIASTNTSLQQVFNNFNGTTNSNGTNSIGYYYYSGDTNGYWGYGDLAAFLAFASTNNLATLQTNYPGVVVSSYTNFWVAASNVTYSYYYTNPPYGSPVGLPQIFVVQTNYWPYLQAHYVYQFANVFTNHIYTNRNLLVTTTVEPVIGSPVGSPAVTNVVLSYTNQLAGDFFVLPMFNFGSFNFNHSGISNVCPLDILYVGLTNVLTTTNFINVAVTNLPIASNTVSSISISNSQYTVAFYTNYAFVYYPVTCSAVTNATGLYQGIENIKFVRADYDSLLGQYWQPVTNNYTMVNETNSLYSVQHFQRIVTTPDFLFSAADQAAGPGGLPLVMNYSENLNFNTANVLTNLAGPGTITTPTTISFEKVGPVYFNSYADVMDGTSYFTQTPGTDVTDLYYGEYFVWASYGGTTNAPVLYPNGTSIDSLGNMLQVVVSPASLPNGMVDWPLTTTFTATGGSFTLPFTWTATGLPNGLSLSSAGKLSGTPTQSGNFVFNLTLTDFVGRTVQWNYSLTISPDDE